MLQSDVQEFVATLANVEQEENYGYTFFFIGDDHQHGFVTIADSDNEYDNVSNLARDGVFRINIGVSRKTFKNLFPDYESQTYDYSVLNTFLPHPDYAKQNFICILNPSGDHVDSTKQYIREAHANATTRYQHKTKP